MDAKYEEQALLSVGYAPGHYMSTCYLCEKDMSDVDKRCRVCLECAKKRLAEAEQRQKDEG